MLSDVVPVAYALPEKECRELLFWDAVRAETLKRLCAMPSYECKNLRWKNIWYDYHRKRVLREMEGHK